MDWTKPVLERLKKPIPAWVILMIIIIAASASAGAYLALMNHGPKPDFNMRPYPSPLPVLPYPNEAVFTINVSSVDSFSGVVTLSAGAPPGVNATIFTRAGNGIILLGKSDDVSVIAYSKAVGNYTIRVTGTAGLYPTRLTSSCKFNPFRSTSRPTQS